MSADTSLTQQTLAAHPVLVVADHAGGLLTAGATEVLSLARSLTSGPVEAIALVSDPDLDGLARYGAGTVYVPDFPDGVSPSVSAVAAEAVLQVAAGTEASAILLVSTFAGKELAPRLALGLGSGAIVDATGVHRGPAQDGAAEGELLVSKTVLQATWDTVCRVTSGVPVIAVKPTAVDAEPVEGIESALVRVPVEISQTARAVEVTASRSYPRDGAVPLSEARAVVAGGRGTEGDFSLLHELAELLDAAVGATRDATDEGWIDHAAQIGQTGATIAPRLYLGAGISGAIHHTAGISAAETIVAINTDSEAPIFELADLGIVGDLHDVLPQAIAALREHQAASSAGQT